MLKLDMKLFESVFEVAKASSRKRFHFDLRTQAFEPLTETGLPSWKDQSMKMLNVMMKETVIPIHRHNETNEVVIVLAGAGYEVEYIINDAGELVETERVYMVAGSTCAGIVVPSAAWPTFIP